jgi:hypothetical protein
MFKRILLAAAFAALFAVPVSAQMLQAITAGSRGTNGGGCSSSYQGPGDVATFDAFGGLQAFDCAHAASNAPLVNVRLNSTGETCDFLASSTTGRVGVTGNCSNGAHNGETAATYCATSNDCFVVTVYEYSTTGNNWTQATTTAQPSIDLSAMLSKVSMKVNGNGATDSIPQASNYTLVSNESMVMVAECFQGGGSGSVLATIVDTLWSINCSSSLGTISLNANSTSFNATMSGTAGHFIVGMTGATALVSVDGTESTTTLASGSGTGKSTFFSLQLDGQAVPLVGSMGYFSGNWTSTQRHNLCLNYVTNWGTPSGSC